MDQLPAVESSTNPIDQVIRGFVPTRRFALASFDSYHADPRFPSQAAAQARLRDFAAQIGQQQRAHLLNRLIRKPAAQSRAIYLDGGFGVGKTHLLAATYHAVTDQRLYLSFGELAYSISRLGLEPMLTALDRTRLLCIDEFELDDVAQTRMAAMFLRRLLERRGRPIFIVTTSNTLPSDLGRGRFAAEAFQREIGEIAASFEVLTIDGEDYRHRRWADLASATAAAEDEARMHYGHASAEDDATLQQTAADAEDDATLQPCYAEAAGDANLQRSDAADLAGDHATVWLRWPQLATELEAVHPVHYAQIAAQLDALYVADVATIEHQAVALRLVHFVDKLYDQEVRLTLSTHNGLPLTEIFAPAYRHGGYEKKYRRCLSRLHELIAETNKSRYSTNIPGQPAR